MRTAVSVGVGTDCIARLNPLKKKLEITKMEIDKIEQGLAKFEEMEKERGVSYRKIRDEEWRFCVPESRIWRHSQGMRVK